MGRTCSAVGCSNSDKEKDPNIIFYKFPSSPKRLKIWKKAVNRESSVRGRLWEPTKCSFLCSRHFVAGLWLLYALCMIIDYIMYFSFSVI